MNEYLDSVAQVLPVVAFAILMAMTLLILAKTYVKHHLVIAFFNSLIMRVFATVLGVALICVSAFLNVGFVVGVGKGYPEAAHLIPVLAVLAGAVNLAAPLAIVVAWVSYKKKRYGLTTVAGVAYLLILMFSLTTGSTVIHSSSNNISVQQSNADLTTATLNAQIASNKAQMQQTLTTANPEAMALGASTMTNANGTRVSVARYCKQGNWYHNNRTECRNYLSAQQSTAALAGVTTLRSENKKLLQEALQAQLNKPTHMTPKFLMFDLPKNIMFSLCILVLEIAALVGFLYSIITAPSDTKEITVQQVQSELDLAQTARQTARTQSQSGKVKSGQSGNVSNLKKMEKAAPLKEQKRAFMASIGSADFDGIIENELLEDLLYQLAKYNGDSVFTIDQILAVIADNNEGVSVGKQRLLKLVSSDRMSDIVLTDTRKKPTVYKFKRQENTSDVSPATSTEGLPASQSALSESGPADHVRRAG